jgi:type VI secretion system protein ImpC
MQVSAVFGAPLPERHSAETVEPDAFRILMMGDFGATIDPGKILDIDRDTEESVMERLQVTAVLNDVAGVGEVRFPIRELDDFHPDRLFQQLKLFESLRNQRSRLQNTSTFAAEAAAIMASGKSPAAERTTAAQATEPAATSADAQSTAESTAAAADMGSLLERTLEHTRAVRPTVEQHLVLGGLDVDELVRRIVAPYVLHKPDARQAEFVAAVDDAIAALMNNVLHHPAFQQLEAAWRGVRMLVRQLSTDATLRLGLLQTSRQQLQADLNAADNLTQSRLHQILVDNTVGLNQDPWTVVVGNYTFSHDAEDTDLLGRLSRIHAAAGSVFVAAAAPEVAGCPDLVSHPDPHDWSPVDPEAAQRWQQLRSLPESRSLVLAMPRILARRVYGADTDPIEAFRFEEIPNGSVHNSYLWMNRVLISSAGTR